MIAVWLVSSAGWIIMKAIFVEALQHVFHALFFHETTCKCLLKKKGRRRQHTHTHTHGPFTSASPIISPPRLALQENIITRRTSPEWAKHPAETSYSVGLPLGFLSSSGRGSVNFPATVPLKTDCFPLRADPFRSQVEWVDWGVNFSTRNRQETGVRRTSGEDKSKEWMTGDNGQLWHQEQRR